MFDIKRLAVAFLSSPEGQKMVMRFLASPEGQKQLQQFISSSEGKCLVIQVVNQTIGMLNLDENTKNTIISALDNVSDNS